MKYSIMGLLIVNAFCHAEGLSPNDMQNIEQIRAQREMQQREEDFNTPVKVDEDSSRASLGAQEAPITIYAFSDFQCPYCQRGAETVAEIRKKYGKKIRFQFRHMPLNFHPQALPAAKAFEALALQSSKVAYRFHDEIFKAAHRLKDEGISFIEESAKKAGGNVAKMKADMESEKVLARVNGDIAEAGKLGITGTPAFIIAGVRLYGAYPPSEFSKIIDRRLKAKK